MMRAFDGNCPQSDALYTAEDSSQDDVLRRGTHRCSSHNLGEHDGGTAVWTLPEGGIGRLEPCLFVGPDHIAERQDGCS